MLRYICDSDFLAHSRATAAARREGLTWDAVATQYLTLYQRLNESRH